MTMSSRGSAHTKKELWLRLRNYHFEHLVPPHLLDSLRAAFTGSDPSTEAFADKLVRKLHWSRPFALRAIGEYKKFVYLGMVSDFPVTPPRVIDQVWHEHLLFSRGYREFCDVVLGRPFDHHPELVPLDDQTTRFQAQYAGTLGLYRAEFGREAPAAFWGTPKFAGRPGATPRRDRPGDRDAGTAVTGGSDMPLHLQFDGSGGGPHGAMPEFGEGGSGGGGGGGEWGDGHAGADSSSSDGGGGSDGGGSGCSSGCGGGGD